MQCLKKFFSPKNSPIPDTQPNREQMIIPVSNSDASFIDSVIPKFNLSGKKEIYPLATRVDLDPDRGGIMKPTHVVHHYTVSYKTEPTVQYFKSQGVDIHLIIGHKGEVVQMSEFNRQCAHAGASKWQGLKNFNSFSIGIEHINLGPLRESKNGYVDYYDRKYEKSEIRIRKGFGYEVWEPLTDAQEQRMLEISLYLYKAYGIQHSNHVGHYEISGFRGKADPYGSYSWGDMIEVRKKIGQYILEAKRRGLA